MTFSRAFTIYVRGVAGAVGEAVENGVTTVAVPRGVEAAVGAEPRISLVNRSLSSLAQPTKRSWVQAGLAVQAQLRPVGTTPEMALQAPRRISVFRAARSICNWLVEAVAAGGRLQRASAVPAGRLFPASASLAALVGTAAANTVLSLHSRVVAHPVSAPVAVEAAVVERAVLN